MFNIIKKILILALFIMPIGCGSDLMFTYSDQSYENYLEDQRQETPWQSDTAEMQLKKYDNSNSPLNDTLKGRVKKVVDGETILLESGEFVKLIGVEAPETGEAFFDESTKFNSLLVDKKTLNLQFDLQGRDANGNLLAYVHAEGVFVNAQIIKHGYGKFSPHPKNTRHQELFKVYESEAIRFGKGIWAK